MTIGVVLNESSVAVVEEVTEGTYVAPTAATDYIEVLNGGAELNKTREELTRDILSGTVETEASRVGIAEVTGTLNVEYKASATEGAAPQSLDVLLKSLLGGKRQITSAQTSSTGHSSTVINFADASDFSKGDIVLVKEAGAYECRPISAVDATSITFPFALENGAPSDAVEVAKVTTYYHDAKNAPSFSVEHNIGSQAIKQKAAGMRSVSGSVENWSVGQLPNFNFSVQGTSLEREDADASYAGDFSADGNVPVTLSACAWIGGNKRAYTELALSIENEVNYIQSACDASGRIGSRITSQTVTASINPYLDDSDLTEWDTFNSNDNTSLFFYAYNPTSTDGEFGEVVAGWIPQARITAAPVADADGIVTQALEIKAHREAGNDSVFISFI